MKEVGSPGLLFEKLGLNYIGPVNGHDFNSLFAALRQARNLKGPSLVHVKTIKGRGYAFAEKNKLDLGQICFMGDDVNDLGALQLAGFSAAPANAHESVKRIAKLITTRSGGNGAVRELLDVILAKKASGKK